MEAYLIEHAGDVYLRILDDLLVVLPIYLAHCPYLVREVSAYDTVALTDLFVIEKLPIDGSLELAREICTARISGISA